MLHIAPSILSADFSRLGEEVRAISAAGADLIHIDVMDGRFVPNLTIGPGVVAALKPHTTLPFDVHLMVENPDALIPAFARAGADILTVHAEACVHLDRTLAHIRSLGVRAGVSLVPSTAESALEYIINSVDLILVMTVNPGFGGQAFLPSQIGKIRRIRAMIDASGRDVALEVDGGINPETARQAAEAGANVLVAGSAVFTGGADKYASNINSLRP